MELQTNATNRVTVPDLSYIETIKASAASNTFLFGNDWGALSLGSLSPAYFDAIYDKIVNDPITLDTSAVTDPAASDVTVLRVTADLDSSKKYDAFSKDIAVAAKLQRAVSTSPATARLCSRPERASPSVTPARRP